jgi:hypothetical protein
MIALVAILLTGCSPQPASIKFDGEATVTVHKTDVVPMNKATVLDKDGKKIDPQPALACTANPATVAKLDKDKITPVANGESTVECKVNEVKGSYKFVVALPDKVEIAGYTAGTPWPVGQAAMLTATVKAGDAAVDGQTVTWASNNEAVATVDAKGNVMGVSAGKATITATAGTLSATVDVEIGGAAMAADGAAAPAAAPATK